MSARLHVALVHHPVLRRDGGIVTSAITNLDVHDIARSARTYGVATYFLVHPVELQRKLVDRIVDHWTHASSAERIPTRKEALAIARPVASLEDLYASLGGRDKITVWATSAARGEKRTTFGEGAAMLRATDKDVVLLFGTSWGLTPETLASCDAVLEPLDGPASDYNHLSVRAACAIILDRLLAARLPSL